MTHSNPTINNEKKQEYKSKNFQEALKMVVPPEYKSVPPVLYASPLYMSRQEHKHWLQAQNIITH